MSRATEAVLKSCVPWTGLGHAWVYCIQYTVSCLESDEGYSCLVVYCWPWESQEYFFWILKYMLRITCIQFLCKYLQYHVFFCILTVSICSIMFSFVFYCKAARTIFYGWRIPTTDFSPCWREKNIKNKKRKEPSFFFRRTWFQLIGGLVIRRIYIVRLS